MEEESRFLIIAGIGIVCGMVLGFATGVLMAPQSGHRTRRQLANYVEDVKDRATEMSEDAKSQMSKVVKQGMKLAQG